jgi:hypothetical protein
MRRRTKQTQLQTGRTETDSEPRDSAYRSAIAFMARTLVADIFDQHETCLRRECRSGGCCQAYAQGGFCPAEMDSRQALLFAAMMAFHDVLRGEIEGFQPIEAGA